MISLPNLWTAAELSRELRLPAGTVMQRLLAIGARPVRVVGFVRFFDAATLERLREADGRIGKA